MAIDHAIFCDQANYGRKYSDAKTVSSVAAPSNKGSIGRKCGRLEAAGTWSAYYKEHA